MNGPVHGAKNGSRLAPWRDPCPLLPALHGGLRLPRAAISYPAKPVPGIRPSHVTPPLPEPRHVRHGALLNGPSLSAQAAAALPPRRRSYTARLIDYRRRERANVLLFPGS